MNKLKQTFSAAIAAACLIPAVVHAQENFMNFGAVPAKADAKLVAEMDKPFNDFIKVWMKDNSLQALTRLVGGDIGYLEKKRTFFVRNEEDFNKMVTDAVGTFKAYCDHHQGQVETLNSDIFCLLPQQPTAWMSWKFEGNHANFSLDGNQFGRLAYKAKVTDIVPGKSIDTTYGRALVIEKGQNGLIKVQPANGGERWISTSNVLVIPR